MRGQGTRPQSECMTHLPTKLTASRSPPWQPYRTEGTIGVLSKPVLTKQRKGKPDAMAISHSSVGRWSRAGTGKLLARRRAQFIKDPCADYGVTGGYLAVVRGSSSTMRKHGGQGRTIAVVACCGVGHWLSLGLGCWMACMP